MRSTATSGDCSRSAEPGDGRRGLRSGEWLLTGHRHAHLALAVVDQVAVIQGGRLAAFGPKDQIIAQPREEVATEDQRRKEARTRVSARVSA